MMHVDDFAENGYVKIEAAAPREVAEAAQRELWTRIPMSPDQPESWTEPVVWAADLRGDGPFGVLTRSRKLADTLERSAGLVAGCRADRWATYPSGSRCAPSSTTAGGTSTSTLRCQTARGRSAVAPTRCCC